MFKVMNLRLGYKGLGLVSALALCCLLVVSGCDNSTDTSGSGVLRTLPGTVTVTGDRFVGQTLTAVYSGNVPVTYQWNRWGSALNNATNQQYTLVVKGAYSVTVSAEGYKPLTSLAFHVTAKPADGGSPPDSGSPGDDPDGNEPVAVEPPPPDGSPNNPFIMQGDLTDAINYINDSANPGVYLLELHGNVQLGNQILSRPGTELVLRGGATEARIEAITYNRTLFNITNGAALTLENNITLVGHPSSNDTVVSISHGNFTMEDGSKITGHNSSSLDGVVFVGPGAVNGPARIFTMNGGEISGNHNSTTNPQGYTISAITVHNGGQFIMTGGRIAGNTNNFPGDSPLSVGDNLGKADVRIFETGVFTISGSAFIDALFLHSTTTTRASINVGGPWTGRIGSLSIRTSVDTFAQAMSTYEDQQIITLNDDVSFTLQELREKFPIDEFRANAAPHYQLISETHNLNVIGVGGGFGLVPN